MVRPAGHYLRNQVDIIIILRGDVPALPRRYRAIIGRGNKRREKLINVTIDLVKRIAKYISGDALKRREVYSRAGLVWHGLIISYGHFPLLLARI